MVAVAESGVILDVLELRIDGTELPANAFDESANIGAKALITITGREILAMNEIVNLTIGDIFADAKHQQRDDLELG